jgi:hypothetical protein
MNPGENTVSYSLTASLKVPKPFTVHMDPTVLELYRPETKPNRVPYIKVELPALKLHGNAAVNITEQQATILDKDQFTQFLAYAVYQEEFEMSAYGKTTAYLGKLKAHITLDKTVKLKGGPQLIHIIQGTATDCMQVSICSKASRSIMPNSSFLQKKMGRTSRVT